jgi:flagellar basal body rod protein FlgG
MNIDLLDAAASGMDAQRAALDVAARNVAAAEAAGPNADYARMIPEFQVVDSGDGDVRVDFTGTRTERGTNVDASIFEVGKSLAEKTIDLERL